MARLSLDQLTVTSFQTSPTEPAIGTEGNSIVDVCTCIGICPTDDTCIAYGCPSGPATILEPVAP